jgi:hypothetical protein
MGSSQLYELLDQIPHVLFVDTVRLLLPAGTDVDYFMRGMGNYCQHGWIAEVGPPLERVNGMIDINLHLPNKQMLSKIGEWVLTRNYLLLGVDLAFDLLCCAEEVVILRSWIDQHMIQRHRRASTKVKLVGQFSPTRYLHREYAGRNVVIYSDRLSKIAAEPCVHIEVRIRTKRALQRVGIQADNLPTLADQETLKNIIGKVVTFVTFDIAEVGKAYQRKCAKMSEETTSATPARRVGNHIARLWKNEIGESEITATAINSLSRKHRLRADRLLKPARLSDIPKLRPIVHAQLDQLKQPSLHRPNVSTMPDEIHKDNSNLYNL